MLVFVESRSALPFLRGTDAQNVFSPFKVVLAMLVFVESKRVGWQKVCSRGCWFMTTTTVGDSVFLADRYHTAYHCDRPMLDTDSAKNGPVML